MRRIVDPAPVQVRPALQHERQLAAVRRWMTPFLMVLAIAMHFETSQAATITVCPTGCDTTSIQAAITQAAAGDTISLISSLPYTENDISVTKNVKITGQGSETTTVQAASSAGIAPTRVFWVFPGVTARIDKMQVRYGNIVDSASGGGCILNEGSLEMQDVDVTECEASLDVVAGADDDGGAIANQGALSLKMVQVTDSQGNRGGGIYNNGSLSAAGCAIENNATTGGGTTGFGGGLFNADNGHATLSDCTIANNVGPDFTIGGGIISSGQLNLIRSTVTGNQRNAIAVTNGLAMVLESRVHANSGSGISVTGAGDLLVRNSTISFNDRGGLRFCGGNPAEVINSTISSNSTSGDGGGIYLCASKRVQIANSTIVNNIAAQGGSEDGDGGGIYLAPVSGCPTLCVLTTAQIRNSLIANNHDHSPNGFRQAPECDGTLHSDGHNLVEQATTSSIFGTCQVSGDLTGIIIGQAPQLAPLAGNLGPTPTHALQSGSPAIDAGNPSGCEDFDDNPLDTDQRGAPRAGACDLGAFEFDSVPDELFADRFES